jgi:hydrogenase expression/formation protein HypD
MTVDRYAGFRDPGLADGVVRKLRSLEHSGHLSFMHVCGTHENSIARHGLRSLLPSWISVIAGPGCPVCVCPPTDIEMAVRLALDHDVIVVTFGDMMAVPGRTSLAEARSEGADIRVVMGAGAAVDLARRTPGRQVVMLAVGFETTACTTAAAILADPPQNFSVLLSHRILPPALEALVTVDDLQIDGFLMPGHVLTVVGTRVFDDLAQATRRPLIVAGFEPLDVLLGLLRLTQAATAGLALSGNAYPRAVRPEGNLKARAAMDRVFESIDAPWRGFGVIPSSGLGLRQEFRHLDAARRYGLTPDTSIPDELPGCRCGDVMIGRIDAAECTLFGRVCTPEEPRGPCMVSFEGTCRNRYMYQDGG